MSGGEHPGAEGAAGASGGAGGAGASGAAGGAGAAGGVGAAGVDSAALEVAAGILGAVAERNGALGARTTYRVGGPAALLVVATGVADLDRVGEAHRRSGLPVLVVGRGSNLLVADRGFPGIAVVLDPGAEEFAHVEVDGTDVHAGAAVALPTLARRTADAGLTGFEWAVGVPGSVGGAVRMNAGGHGSDMARSVAAATVVDLASPGARPERWTPDRLAFGYRRSGVGETQVVVGVTLRLSRGDREAAAGTIRSIVQWRRTHQPGGHNAGSVFTNPTGPGVAAAGALIEAAGLKGHRVGSAEVSSKHANFIQADPGGSADDVEAVIDSVAGTVEAATGIRLRTEIRRVGFGGWPHPDPQPESPSQPHVESESVAEQLPTPNHHPQPEG